MKCAIVPHATMQPHALLAHPQVFAFVLRALLLGRSYRLKSLGTRAVGLIESVGLLVASCLVAASRVYLGYHSIDQVLAGAVLGVVMAFVWVVVMSRLAGVYAWLAGSRLVGLLHLRDTWGVADPLRMDALVGKVKAA